MDLFYYLYVILDIYSRYVAGWMLASRENADLAKRLIRETIEKENVDADRRHQPTRIGSPSTPTLGHPSYA